jgi:hypothetical protein
MKTMPIEMQVRAFAGAFILLSLLLYQTHSRNWLFFTLFVGVNLLQSAFTRFCPLEMILRKLEGKPV